MYINRDGDEASFLLSTKSVFESAFDIAIWMHTYLLSNSIATSVNGPSYDDTRMRSSQNLDARSKIGAAHDEKLLILSVRVVFFAACKNKGARDDRVL